MQVYIAIIAKLCKKFIMSEKYMKNLRELILEKMEEGNYTISRFADECGVSEREISKIKNGEAKNIKCDTLIKICQNADISYENVLGGANQKVFYLDEMSDNIIIVFNNRIYEIYLKRKK